jgi:trehalose 6-phosphate phosphatase
VTPALPLADALAPLREDPRRSAVLLDVDGTLAPIVRDADSAAVPPVVRSLLADLSAAYGLVGCVTGRRASDARRLVGLGTVHYIGIHGAEQLPARAGEPRLDSALAEWTPRITALGRELDTPEQRTLGIRREDKGPIVALHWRGAPDEARAEAAIAHAVERAEAEGLVVHRGRKVLELRPPVPMDKGAGVRSLLEGRDLAHALYAGDDATDLDAFRALDALREAGDLETVVRVGVRSDEGPAAIVDEADVTVDGPEGVADLLRTLG